MRRAASRDQRRAAARAERHALPQRSQSAVQIAGRALVRRRRHAARLPSRERPRQLPQPLGPHREMAGRTRRRPRAVRRLRPETAGHAGFGHPGWRRCQHQYRVSRRTPAGAGGRPSADRDRARYPQDPRPLQLWRQHCRAFHRASQDRSRDRRDGVLRLQRRRTVQPGSQLRIRQFIRHGDAVRSLRRRPMPAWCTISSSPNAICCFRSCRSPAAWIARCTAGRLTPGSRTRAPMSGS